MTSEDETGVIFTPHNLQELVGHEIDKCNKAITPIDSELVAYQAELILKAQEIDNKRAEVDQQSETDTSIGELHQRAEQVGNSIRVEL
jgi:hypothetical protein